MRACDRCRIFPSETDPHGLTDREAIVVPKTTQSSDRTEGMMQQAG